MKYMVVLAAACAISGCAFIDSGPKGPTKLADNADRGMWSLHPVSDVETCVARTVNASPEGNIIRANGITYRFDKPDPSKTYYNTVVSMTGYSSQGDPYVSGCL